MNTMPLTSIVQDDGDAFPSEVALVWKSKAFTERDLANARLIAEAPAMFDALRAVLIYHDGGMWDDAHRAEWTQITGVEGATGKVLCDHIRAVLARAGNSSTPAAPPAPVIDGDSEAEEVHRLWSDAVAGLCEQIGVDPKSFDWSPRETTEETIGGIVGNIEERLPGGAYYTAPAPPAPAEVNAEPPEAGTPTPQVAAFIGAIRALPWDGASKRAARHGVEAVGDGFPYQGEDAYHLSADGLDTLIRRGIEDFLEDLTGISVLQLGGKPVAGTS